MATKMIEITRGVRPSIFKSALLQKREFWFVVFDLFFIMLVTYIFRNETFIEIVGKGVLILVALILLRDLFCTTYVNRDERFAIKKEFKTKVANKVYKALMNSQSSTILRNRHEEVTVLFMDLRGFTALSETLTPQATFTLINNYLSRMTNVIVSHEGTVDKYIGDAIMAFWNAPIHVEGHQKKALDCALELQKEVERFSKELGTNLEVGIGLNSGLVSVGNVGNKYNSDYTVIGDNVNLASRLESLTKKYKLPLLISEAVYKAANSSESDVLFREIDNVIVKGRNTPVTIYEPLLFTKENQLLKLTYEKALRHCRQGNYSDAIRSLKQLRDLPSQVLLERVIPMNKKHHKWDGIWSWDTK